MSGISGVGGRLGERVKVVQVAQDAEQGAKKLVANG